MRAGNLTSAEFVRSNGWTVGTVLRGEPIFIDGRQVEQAKLVRITAIGERWVLCMVQFIGDPPFSSEAAINFDAREWSVQS